MQTFALCFHPVNKSGQSKHIEMAMMDGIVKVSIPLTNPVNQNIYVRITTM